MPSSSAAVFLAAFLFANSTRAQEPVTAFVNVSVIPMDSERVLTEQTVLVRGDRIVDLGPVDKVRVPGKAVRVDGQGKFLMPGLADMHVHIRHPAGASPPDQTLFLYLANGITTVRDMHSGGVDSPQLALRQQVATGKLLGPRIYTAGDPDNSSAEAAAKATEALKAAGHDFVKLYGWPSPIFDSVVAAAARVKLPVVGHVVGTEEDIGIERVLNAHWASMEHLTGYLEYLTGLSLDAALAGGEVPDWTNPDYQWDPAKLRGIAAATQQAGVWNCPTLIVYSSHPLAGQNNHLQPAPEWNVKAQARLHFQFELIKALHAAGAGLLLGTDTWFPGFSIHRELKLLVQAGLTPYQAIETGTRNIAVFFGTLDSTGTVAVGKRADLVLLDGNPLQDIGYTAGPAGVMVGGRWLARAELDARLDAMPTYIDQANRSWNIKEVRRWHEAGVLRAEAAAGR